MRRTTRVVPPRNHSGPSVTQSALSRVGPIGLAVPSTWPNRLRPVSGSPALLVPRHDPRCTQVGVANVSASTVSRRTAVATLTAAFARRHPLVDIEVLSMSTQQILGGLRSFELDGGIAYLESTANDLAAVPLWCENHVLLTPRDGPFEGRDCVTWHEAARIPLCLLTANMHNRQTIDSVFASLGEQPRPTLETDSIVSILAHVSAGHWSSIVPRAVLDLIGIPTGTRVFELRDPLVEWATGLLVLNRQPRSPMVEALMGEARALNLGMQDSTRVT